MDGPDFLAWQQQFGFSPGESLELVFDCGNEKAGMARTFTIEATNASGNIIGEIALQNSGTCEDMRTGERSRGFGFITMGSSEDGVLLINGERYGALTQNSMTGRYLLGLTMVSSHSPAAGRGAPNATITVVAPDGGSQVKYEITIDLRESIGRINGITTGSSMQAITLAAPPQARQVSTSISNTRFSRCAQVIATWRWTGVFSS